MKRRYLALLLSIFNLYSPQFAFTDTSPWSHQHKYSSLSNSCDEEMVNKSNSLYVPRNLDKCFNVWEIQGSREKAVTDGVVYFEPSFRQSLCWWRRVIHSGTLLYAKNYISAGERHMCQAWRLSSRSAVPCRRDRYSTGTIRCDKCWVNDKINDGISY